MADKIQAVNFRWQQGEDLKIELIYKEGDSTSSVPVPLGVGYSLRMDLVNPDTGASVYTLNSDDSDTLTADEVVLSDGANGGANITITVPRSITLTGGALFTLLTAGKTSFPYDIFLRNTLTNTQSKILRGSVIVEASHTLWQ